MQSSLRLLALALALGPALGGCSSPDPSADVVDLVKNGEYARALRAAERNASAAPGDQRAQEILRKAKVAYLLQETRLTLFEGDPAGALALVEAAAEIDPGDPTVATWTLKIKRQLAEEWLDAANDLSASGKVEDALDAYERALAYDPESNAAKLGVARVLLTMNYREGRSKSYYNKALEALRDYLLPQADNSFAKALHYDKTNDRARDRRQEVREALVSDRLDAGQRFEEQKLWFAARNEYRIALLIEPESESASDGFDRMDREVRARRGLDEAEMDVYRGELDRAKEALDESERFSEQQGEEVTVLRNRVEEADLETLYQHALDLERDYRFEEAVRAFDDLLDETGGSYADAATRRAALQDFADRAARLYAQYEAADNDLDRLRSLREIDVFWPEYRDVPELLSDFVRRGNELFQRARGAATAEEALGHLRELESFWPGYPGLAAWKEKLAASQEER